MDLRLRRRVRRRRRARRRRGARALPGRVHRRLARRHRERRLQRARPSCGARPARRDGPAGDRALPAAGARRLQRALHGAGAARPSRRRGRAGGAVPRPLRPRSRPHAGVHGRGRAKDRGGDRRRRQPRRGPHPAQLPRGRAGDAADQPLPARRGRRTQAVPVVQARSRAGAAAARSAPALRDLRLLAARRGRAPARRRRRPRRPALVRSPRGLPDGDPRPDEGADGQERPDRARRRQGRLRGQAPARGPRAAGRRGRRLLPDLHQRPARPVRHRPRGSGDAAAARRAPRRRRSVPRRRRGQGHGDVLGHRQRDRGGVRLLARRRVRVRRLGRLRPQGDGDHGAQRLGVGQAPLPRARDRHAEQRLHRRGGRRHVGRRVRQRHAAVAAHQARRRVRPPSRVHRPRPRPGGVLRRAAPAVRAAALLVGRLRPLADLRGRRRLAAHREVDHGVGGGAEGARDRGRPAHAVGADPRAAARARSTCCGTAGSGPTSRPRARTTPTSATRPTTPSASTPASSAAASSGRAATSASRSAAASSTRSPAGRSTPTRSTTPAA